MMTLQKEYIPSRIILNRYADILVNFALNSGEGIKKGEVVMCVVPDVAKPLALELQNVILKAGGHPMIRLVPTGFDKDFFAYASEEQVSFFPKKYLFARADMIDHQIGIIATTDPDELKGSDPKKIVLAQRSRKPLKDRLFEKEAQGKFTWTLALWGTPKIAEEVGMTEKEYWDQIIKACFLDKDDPIIEWKQVYKLQNKIMEKLNSLEIDSVHMYGADCDLNIKLGPERLWNGGSGRNIPSFELFTSPDWRGTEGWIRFNQPLYRYGQVIKDIELQFKGGVVVKAKAKTGNKFLQEMLKTENADKVGEYSLTDKRMSRITKVMAETLFDENIGGPYGNTHLALGSSYHDCFRGDQSKMKKGDWAKLGYNDSAEHTDIISTIDRTVVAKLTNGKERVIYKDGSFAL